MTRPEVKLADLFDRAELDRCLEERLVVRRIHPNGLLGILNYTERCQYERGLWSPVTTQCRGLIYCLDTEEIQARPFRKFFNYGQAEAPQMDPMARVIASDKLDGSLGILYPVGKEWAIATRGAFESEQAIHATALLRAKYPAYRPPPGLTVLFEIVYPENRIVLDYGQTDDLILLGAVETDTGRTFRPDGTALGWPGPTAPIFPYETLADALAAPSRRNAEGLVLHFPDTDERVKVKQEDYVALHRIVTGLNERTVWEHLAGGAKVEELLTNLPDEFHQWTRDVADRLTRTVTEGAEAIEEEYAAIVARLPEGFDRKAFALEAKASPLAWGLFAKHSGKDYWPGLWKDARPECAAGPRPHSEDVA